MMTSVKMALSTRARPSVIGRLTTITPPKGACVSVSKAFCHALRRSSSSWPTPQGFVCFKMPTVGRAELGNQLGGPFNVQHVRIGKLLALELVEMSPKLPYRLASWWGLSP